MIAHRLFYNLLLVFLLFCVEIGVGQVDFNPDFDIAELEINRNKGSAATVNKMLVSDDGFLWYTTFNGLVKHYGSTSVVFPFNDSLDEGIGSFSDIIEDRNGDIWIATNQGLYFFDVSEVKGALYTWENPETNTNVKITSIAQNVEGHMVATTDSRYILQYVTTLGRFVSYRVPDAYYEESPEAYGFVNYFINVEETYPDGGVVLSQFNKFYRYKKGEVTMLKDYSRARRPGNIQSRFELLENGSIFPKSTSGSYTFEGKSYSYDYLPLVDRHLIQFSSLDFRILTTKIEEKKAIQFYRIDPENRRRLLFYKFDVEKGALVQEDKEIDFGGVIADVVGSKEGYFYVSTPQKMYAVRPKQKTFQTFLTSEQETEIPIRISARGFAQNQQGEIFVATYSGLFKIAPDSMSTTRIDDSFLNDSKEITSSYRELLFRGDYLWSGGEEPIIRRIDLENKEYKNYSLTEVRNDKSVSILSWKPWGKDRLLIGTSKGLFSFNFITEEIVDLSKLNESNNLSSQSIRSIYVESEDKIWLATGGAGIFIKDFKDNTVDQLTVNNTNQTLGSNVVYAIHKGRDSKMYFGTYDGLTVWDVDEQQMINFKEKDGLSNNIVVAIQETEDGLWLSTYNGLVGYQKEDDWFYNFYEKDGLPENEFNQQSYFTDRDGYMYFGGLNGFAKFDPQEVSFKKPNQRIEAVGVEFFDKNQGEIIKSSLNLDKRLEKVVLPYDKNFFNISYAIPDPFDTDRPIFEYNLGGKSDDWISLGNDTNLRLNALSPGNYSLKIRAKDSSGNPTVNNLDIPIQVKQIFYKKPWFVTVNILILSLMAVGFYQYRKYRWKDKLKQQRVVDQLESKALRAQMNPHFIFNTLNGLQSTMILKGEKAANKYLGAFSSLLRSTLDMSKSDTLSLDEEVKYLSAYLSLEKLRQARELESKITLQPEDMDLKSIYLPCMIFQPLIENAILHGLAPKREGDSTVTIEFIEEDGFIIGVVTDNGIGRKAAAALKAQNRKAHKSWATSIMEERIEIINKYTSSNVDFQIEDLYENNKPSGTRVTVKLPILSEMDFKKILI